MQINEGKKDADAGVKIGKICGHPLSCLWMAPNLDKGIALLSTHLPLQQRRGDEKCMDL